MAIKIVHETEFEEIFETNSGKKKSLKLDNSGNVQFSKSATGLKGEVELPEIPEVPVALNGATIAGRTITFTKTDGSQAATVELPAAPVDVKLHSLEFTANGKLKATLSDESITEVDFSAEVVVKALEAATPEQKNRLKAVFLTFLKGEEVQNVAGETKGFLLSAA